MNNGNNIKNIIKVTLATTALTFGILTFNHTSADAKTLTYKEAAQKIADTAKKAYNEKKKVTVKVTVPCKKNSTVGKNNSFSKICASCEKVAVSDELESGKVETFDIDLYPFLNSEDGYKSTYKYNNGNLVVTTTINGKNKTLRNCYEENYYFAANVDELKEVTKDMTTKEKAWRVATWLMVDHHLCYSSKYNHEVDAKKIYKNYKYNRDCGAQCFGLAATYAKYAEALGLKVCYAETPYKGKKQATEGHIINCIKIDGTMYYLEMQEVFSRNEEWVAFSGENYHNLSNEEKENAKSLLECGIGSSITGYPWELSECDYAMITFKEASKYYKGFMGDPKKWNYGSFENYAYGKQTKDVAKLPDNK